MKMILSKWQLSPPTPHLNPPKFDLGKPYNSRWWKGGHLLNLSGPGAGWLVWQMLPGRRRRRAFFFGAHFSHFCRSVTFRSFPPFQSGGKLCGKTMGKGEWIGGGFKRRHFLQSVFLRLGSEGGPLRDGVEIHSFSVYCWFDFRGGNPPLLKELEIVEN